MEDNGEFIKGQGLIEDAKRDRSGAVDAPKGKPPHDSPFKVAKMVGWVLSSEMYSKGEFMGGMAKRYPYLALILALRR